MEILYGAGSVDHEMKKMIFGAEKYLMLASPFFKVDREMEEILFCKKEEGVKITLFTRTASLNLEQSPQKYLSKIYNLPRLHTKLYISERSAIFASANLYEFSLQNNHEMGLLFSKQWDPEAYEKLSSEVNFFKCPASENSGLQLVWNCEVNECCNNRKSGILVEKDYILDICKKCGISYTKDYTGIHRIGEEIFIFCKKSSTKDITISKDKYKNFWNEYVLGTRGLGHFQCMASDLEGFFGDDSRILSKDIKIFVDNIYYEKSELYCYQLPYEKNGDCKWTIILCTKENKNMKDKLPVTNDIDQQFDDETLFSQFMPDCLGKFDKDSQQK